MKMFILGKRAIISMWQSLIIEPDGKDIGNGPKFSLLLIVRSNWGEKCKA